MERINTYFNRINAISNLINTLQNEEDTNEKNKLATLILGLIESGSTLETKARIDLKEIINN